MAKLAYLLLCHTAPQAVIDQVARLTAAGDCVALHFDRSAPARDFALIRKALAGNPAVTFARRRIRCGWGEWSLVAATLQCLHAALRAFPDATHLYLISGDCSPIKTAEHIRARLDARDEDLIESVDFHTSGWIRTGLRAERLIYRHWFNERRQPRLFYGALDLQRRLGLARSMPRGLEMRIGSQWWCLRRTTAEAVLALCARRPELIRFFRTTWIPDECFFQTLVHHLVPRSQIAGRAPTFHIFSDYGLPVTFHADHHDLLLGQDHLFARKIASAALKARLGALYAATGQSFAPAADAARLYALQAGQGRRGHRTPPRAWEEGTSLGRDRHLHLLVCDDLPLARSLAARIAARTGLPALGHIFHDASAPLPDLGGIESTLDKRNRHRRALVRLVFEALGTDRLLLCTDPEDLALLQDFHADRTRLIRSLLVATGSDEAALAARAAALGLAAPHLAPEALRPLFPALRRDRAAGLARLRDAGLPGLSVLDPDDSQAQKAVALAHFLAIPVAEAEAILAPPDPFTPATD